jgi:hypothetical protein
MLGSNAGLVQRGTDWVRVTRTGGFLSFASRKAPSRYVHLCEIRPQWVGGNTQSAKGQAKGPRRSSLDSKPLTVAMGPPTLHHGPPTVLPDTGHPR